MSESHCHSHCRQPQPPVHNHLQLPDPSHLSFDHLHLRSLISTPINSTRSLTLIVWSTVHYPERYLTATHLPVFTYLLDLPAISCDYPWTPGSPSDSPANSPAHPSVGLPSPVDKNSSQFVHEPPGFSLPRYSPSLPSPYSLSSLQYIYHCVTYPLLLTLLVTTTVENFVIYTVRVFK